LVFKYFVYLLMFNFNFNIMDKKTIIQKLEQILTDKWSEELSVDLLNLKLSDNDKLLISLKNKYLS